MDIIFLALHYVTQDDYKQLFITYVNNVFIVFFLIFIQLNLVSFTFVKL